MLHLILALACAEAPPALPTFVPAQPLVAPVPAPRWPLSSAGLDQLEVSFPKDFGVRRVYVDAGHGSDGNSGNNGCFCQQEELFTLRVADRLAADLEATGHFEIRKSRPDKNVMVGYKKRVADASDWADAFVSIHSDVRGPYEPWEPRPGELCNRNKGYHGFSVLWSDEGDEPLLSRREQLSDALSNRMAEAGFHPYDGIEYENLYRGNPEVPGSFVDVHEPGQRIMVLRRPTIPSVIIETHQAIDPEDVARWGEERTLAAFTAAVTAGLADAL
mgnify:CR=1 FL=1